MAKTLKILVSSDASESAKNESSDILMTLPYTLLQFDGDQRAILTREVTRYMHCINYRYCEPLELLVLPLDL